MGETRIRVLDPETAKKIAAGEVIDRPAAALRELLDNALDSGATNVAVELKGGGADGLRVVDDGCGMGRDDLAMSILPHATSKISSVDDLLSLSTLGFRGEALSSIAAVARLEMTSAASDGEAWRLSSSPGGNVALAPAAAPKGTSVSVSELFAAMPARRKFLKRAQAEGAACRNVFVDKAMAFPDVGFRLSSERGPVLVLSRSSRVDRAIAAMAPDAPKEFFRELSCRGEGFQARIVAGLPSLYRTDRRHLIVFVNGRRVQEYAIAQALEYAYRGALPGGAWPMAYAFVEIDPGLADFNIHPAKKEVRIKNVDEIRSAIIGAVRDYLGYSSRLAGLGPSPVPGPGIGGDGTGLGPGAALPGAASGGLWAYAYPDSASGLWDGPQEGPGGGSGQASGPSFEPGPRGPGAGRESWPLYARDAAEARERGYREPQRAEPVGVPQADPGFRYLGQALGVFLVFERAGALYMMDQHAAHERHLYDRLMAGPMASQELLVPIVHEPETDEEDRYLREKADDLAAAGFRFVREGASWLVEAAPAIVPEAVSGAIIELVRRRPETPELIRDTVARAACRAAIKDGDALDETGAIELIRFALALPEPFCPHGRPIWLRLGREELYRAVRRLV